MLKAPILEDDVIPPAVLRLLLLASACIRAITLRASRWPLTFSCDCEILHPKLFKKTMCSGINGGLNMKLSEVRDILNAKVLVGEEHMDRTVFGAGSADLIEDVLAAVAKDALLMTGVISEEVIRTSKVIGVGAVVFVRGKRPTQRMLALAKSHDLPVLLTRESLFVSSGRLYMNGLRGLDGAW